MRRRAKERKVKAQKGEEREAGRKERKEKIMHNQVNIKEK